MSLRTGSGKTHAYLLPMLSKLMEAKWASADTVSLGALVVVPTRELAHQVTKMTEALVRGRLRPGLLDE